MHVTHRVHRVPSNRSKPEGRMEVDVPRCPHGTHGMIRGACGAFHVDAKRQGYVGMAECYGVDSLVESESAGHAVAEHLHDRSRQRSEEHTSELQSLMRISYAVFCLKKKKTPQSIPPTITTYYINSI